MFIEKSNNLKKKKTKKNVRKNNLAKNEAFFKFQNLEKGRSSGLYPNILDTFWKCW